MKLFHRSNLLKKVEIRSTFYKACALRYILSMQKGLRQSQRSPMEFGLRCIFMEKNLKKLMIKYRKNPKNRFFLNIYGPGNRNFFENRALSRKIAIIRSTQSPFCRGFCSWNSWHLFKICPDLRGALRNPVLRTF